MWKRPAEVRRPSFGCQYIPVTSHYHHNVSTPAWLSIASILAILWFVFLLSVEAPGFACFWRCSGSLDFSYVTYSFCRDSSKEPWANGPADQEHGKRSGNIPSSTKWQRPVCGKTVHILWYRSYISHWHKLNTGYNIHIIEIKESI